MNGTKLHVTNVHDTKVHAIMCMVLSCNELKCMVISRCLLLSLKKEVIDRNTVPVNKLLLAGTVPVNKLISLLAGTPLKCPKVLAGQASGCWHWRWVLACCTIKQNMFSHGWQIISLTFV